MTKAIKSLIVILTLILTSQSAFCYVLAPNELKQIVHTRIHQKVQNQLKDISSDFIIAIQGIPQEKIATNENAAPKIQIVSQNNIFSANQYKTIYIKDSKNQTIKSFPINVQTKVYKEVLVANNTIVFNQEINSLNTRMERMEISRNIENFLTSIPQNKVAKRNYPKNTIITLEGLKDKAVVSKNSLVDIKFQSQKGLEIRMQGYALKDGAIGETILVRSDKFNKTYSATISSANEVIVRI